MRRASALAAIVFGAGCGDGASPRAPELPAPLASSASSATADAAPPALACGVAGDRWCASTDAVSECTPTGETVVHACADTEACVGRACVTVHEPDGSVADPAALRSFSDEGFVDAWSAIVGVGAKAGEDALASGDLEPIGGTKAMRAVCAADGYVAAARAADYPDDDRAVAVLGGVLYNDVAREVVVRSGATGKLTLRIGDQTLKLDELAGREGRAWPDERSLRVKIPAGASYVTAMAEPRSTAFYLRFRELDGSRPVGLAWRERAAACAASALVDPRAELVIEGGGAKLAASPRLAGVVPRTLPPSLAVSLRVGRKVLSTADVAIDAAAMRSREPKRVEASFDLPDKGGFDVRVELGADAVWTRTFPSGTGALAKRARSLVEGAARVEARTSLEPGSIASFARHVETITSALSRGEPDTSWVRRNVDEAEKILAELDAGKDAYVGRRGVVFRAYRSPLDGRLQPYVVFVPRSYDPKRPMPAVLVAHGRDRLPEHALRTLIGQAPDEHMTLSFAAHNLPPMPDLGAILVAPWGYGNGSVLALGEEDARAVIADLSRAYSIDDRRISLTGYSLGGTVGFLYPLHAPGMFSASAPLCGYPNLMGYQSVARVEHALWEPALLARKYIVEYAENGQYVPLHVVHGGKDVPGRSKVVVDRYRDLGYSVVFDVPEDADHNVWDDAYEDGKMIPWLTAKRAPKAPQSIRFVTRDYRYDRAYWLRVERMFSSTGSTRAEVAAKWSPKDSRIELETSNVRVLAIDLGALDPKPTADVTIADSGKELTAPSGGVVWIGREAGGAPTLSTTDPCDAGDKHHDQSGSLDDLASLPVTVVVGTDDAKLVEANRVLADHLARMGGQADVRYPIVDDAAATDDALAGRSVVLVGGPASNTLARALLAAGAAPAEGTAPSVPVRIGASSITVKDHTEEGDDLGVAFVMPRPEGFHGEAISRRAASGYVAIYAGLTAEATLSARMLPRYLPDWVVFDSSLAVERGGLLMDARKPRAAGFFSETWE